ncbi:MAG: hypothetical protein ACYCXN_02715 [Acidimicrobiales bacterium]|jgi:hypothetical protein
MPKGPPQIPGLTAERLASCGQGLYAVVATVRPQTAEQWLDELQRKNRKISPNVVSRYARAMSSGDWRVNGEAIVFSDKGMLMNGQHRLTACVASREPLKVLIVVGVPDTDEMMATFDGGSVRTGGQVLGMASYHNPNVLSSMADIVYKYENNIQLTAKIDSVARLHTVERHPDMTKYTGVKQQVARAFANFPGSLYCGLHYLFTRVNEKKAEEFTNQFLTGYGLQKGQPVAALRTAAIRSSQGRSRMAHTLWYQLVIKVWNTEQEGGQILQGLRAGPREPKHPDIFGLPRGPIN